MLSSKIALGKDAHLDTTAPPVRMNEPIVVCVTGAAGQIAYSLIPMIVNGNVFGTNQPIHLRLLDIEPALGALGGVVMEIDDMGADLAMSVVATANPSEAFQDADAIFMVGAFPRKEGMLRKDLLEKNAAIFKDQGAVIDTVAKKTVKVLVVGNPANTNALIASWNAPSIPPSQFTALTQLDSCRATVMIAKHAGVRPSQVKNLVIWGNHSPTMVPDIENAYIEMEDGKQVGVLDAISDHDWLVQEFPKLVATRGSAVIKARKLSSACSAAKAAADHMKKWHFGTKEGEVATMGVITKGEYGLEEGLIFSQPVTIKGGIITVVEGLALSDGLKEKILLSQDELMTERETARAFLQ